MILIGSFQKQEYMPQLFFLLLEHSPNGCYISHLKKKNLVKIIYFTSFRGHFLFIKCPSQRVVKVEDYKNWYRSSETVSGTFKFGIHLINKKWPLKEVKSI